MIVHASLFTNFLETLTSKCLRNQLQLSRNSYDVIFHDVVLHACYVQHIGGKWKCVHIDDPRSPEIRLPSLSKCLQLTPSQVIRRLMLKRGISVNTEVEDGSSQGTKVSL